MEWIVFIREDGETLTLTTDSPAALLQLWGVDTAHIPSAMVRMATTRRLLARTSGLRFRKLLGTGRGYPDAGHPGRSPR